MRSTFFLKSKIDAVSCISGLKRLKSRAAWYVKRTKRTKIPKYAQTLCTKTPLSRGVTGKTFLNTGKPKKEGEKNY